MKPSNDAMDLKDRIIVRQIYKTDMNIKRCFRKCILSLLLGVGFTFGAYAGNPPFFPTDLALGAEGELIMTQKGPKRVDVFAPDGRAL